MINFHARIKAIKERVLPIDHVLKKSPNLESGNKLGWRKNKSKFDRRKLFATTKKVWVSGGEGRARGGGEWPTQRKVVGPVGRGGEWGWWGVERGEEERL